MPTIWDTGVLHAYQTSTGGPRGQSPNPWIIYGPDQYYLGNIIMEHLEVRDPLPLYGGEGGNWWLLTGRLHW